MTNYTRRDQIIRAAIAAAELPTDLADLAPADRARLESYAETHGSTPEKALKHARRVQRLALIESAHVDQIAANARAAQT